MDMGIYATRVYQEFVLTTGFPYTTRIDHAEPILLRLPAGRVVVAEVGVLRGKLSAVLMRSRPDMTLHMIDWWQANDPESEAYLLSMQTDEPCGVQTPEQVADNYAEARKVAFNFGGKLMQADSVKASESFSDGHFDLVFLDADHCEQAVCNDIAAWWPKVKEGGWLAGHDYETRGMPNGVKAAVDAFAESLGVKPQIDTFYTWFIQKPEVNHGD